MTTVQGRSEATLRTAQAATFFIGDLFFGIDVLRVQEILRYQEMTRVPLAPAITEGLINLLGQIVTAIDMRRRLGLPARTAGALPVNMIVRAEDGAVSLLVDEIGDVLDLDQSLCEAAPDNVSSGARRVLSGVYKLPGRLLLVLDPDKVVQVEADGQPDVNR
jgi:purine-binding chemotaxis protein CheW